MSASLPSSLPRASYWEGPAVVGVGGGGGGGRDGHGEHDGCSQAPPPFARCLPRTTLMTPTMPTTTRKTTSKKATAKPAATGSTCISLRGTTTESSLCCPLQPPIAFAVIASPAESLSGGNEYLPNASEISAKGGGRDMVVAVAGAVAVVRMSVASAAVPARRK